MRKFLPIFVLLAFASAAGASDLGLRVRAYLADRGVDYADSAARGDVLAIPMPDGSWAVPVWNASVLGAYPGESALPTATEAPAILGRFAAARSEALEAAKSVDRKRLENAYCRLVGAVLTVAGAPRAVNGPVSGVPMSEVLALIDALDASDALAAIRFRLELLQIDAVLGRRYGDSWWKTASFHPEIEG